MNGKVAAVLGVGPGLGAATAARRFASEGFAVVLMVRNEDGLSEIQREIEDGGGTALLISTDAVDPASVEAAFGRVREMRSATRRSSPTTPGHSRWAAYWKFHPTGSTTASKLTAPGSYVRM